MAQHGAQLVPWEHARVCFLGLGNTDYGDDGFGVRLASELIKAGVQDVVIGGTMPEQSLGKIAAQEFDHVVFLDATDFEAPPGAVVVLGAREMHMRFPQISTHKISLGVLAELAEVNGRTRCWLLGVQPESIRQSRTLTPTVQATLEIVKELLLDAKSCEGLEQAAQEMEEHVC